MKTGDLQLGDWVRLAYDKKTVRVKAIFRLGVYTDYEGESLNGSYTDFEIESIPLTAYILKRNGFTYGITKQEKELEKIIFFSKRWVFENKDLTIEYFFKFRHSKKNWHYLKISLKKNKEMTFYGCAYLHELQHCLRLCELNDLADNFKV